MKPTTIITAATMIAASPAAATPLANATMAWGTCHFDALHDLLQLRPDIRADADLRNAVHERVSTLQEAAFVLPGVLAEGADAASILTLFDSSTRDMADVAPTLRADLRTCWENFLDAVARP